MGCLRYWKDNMNFVWWLLFYFLFISRLCFHASFHISAWNHTLFLSIQQIQWLLGSVATHTKASIHKYLYPKLADQIRAKYDEEEGEKWNFSPPLCPNQFHRAEKQKKKKQIHTPWHTNKHTYCYIGRKPMRANLICTYTSIVLENTQKKWRRWRNVELSSELI